MESQDSHYLYKEACDDCGSSDAKAVYSNSGTHCFSCGTTHRGDGQTPTKKETKMTDKTFFKGEYASLPSRKITEDTCRRYGYHLARDSKGPVQVANYRKDGELVAQKVRGQDKRFSTVGNPNTAGFFGQHLFREGGRMVVITEGELDAMSAYQALGSKWPCVSLPSGAQSAEKIINQEIEWLESFEKIVLAFDMDEPGQEAVRKVASILEPGKAFVATLPAKDANECIVTGKAKDLVNALWDAHPYRPDGVINANELWEEVIKEEAFDAVPYPYEQLNEVTHGIRQSELVTICSGSGMGKSSFVSEIMYSLLQRGYKVGGLFLEQSVKRSVLGLMGLHLDLPLHIHGYKDRVELDTLKQAFDETVGSGQLMLYDHFGSMEIDTILDKIKYMAAQGCTHICLDHISVIVSGLETSDERKMIDVLMSRLRMAVARFDIALIAVSHLRRPEGVSHENGRAISLSDLRGSQSIAQLSDICLGLERDQQAEDPQARNRTKIRCLKNRYSGLTGPAGEMIYNPSTGRLLDYKGPAIVSDMSSQTSDPLDAAF